jgi:hypothetical protein
MQQPSTLAAPKNKSRVGRRMLRTVVLILLLALVFFLYWHYYYTYSDGYRYGLLQKFSHRGNLFKTYEGEMILSSVRSTNNTTIASEKFYFSVANKSLALQLDNLQGRMVTVHYKQKNSSAFWRGDSEYIVDSVKQE